MMGEIIHENTALPQEVLALPSGKASVGFFIGFFFRSIVHFSDYYTFGMDHLPFIPHYSIGVASLMALSKTLVCRLCTSSFNSIFRLLERILAHTGLLHVSPNMQSLVVCTFLVA